MIENTGHAHVKVPPPLVFLIFAAVALLLNLALPLPTSNATSFRIAGALALAAGFVLGGAAISRTRSAHRSADADRATAALITDGIYRLTCTPIYLGFFLIYVVGTILGGTYWRHS